MLLSLELGWPNSPPSQGSTISRFLPRLIFGAASPALTAGSHSQSGQCPGRLEARSEACFALSLKPKQDYLISLTIPSLIPDVPFYTTKIVPLLFSGKLVHVNQCRFILHSGPWKVDQTAFCVCVYWRQWEVRGSGSIWLDCDSSVSHFDLTSFNIKLVY